MQVTQLRRALNRDIEQGWIGWQRGRELVDAYVIMCTWAAAEKPGDVDRGRGGWSSPVSWSRIERSVTAWQKRTARLIARAALGAGDFAPASLQLYLAGVCAVEPVLVVVFLDLPALRGCVRAWFGEIHRHGCRK